jgi:hypothetical protein
VALDREPDVSATIIGPWNAIAHSKRHVSGLVRVTRVAELAKLAMAFGCPAQFEFAASH